MEYPSRSWDWSLEIYDRFGSRIVAEDYIYYLKDAESTMKDWFVKCPPRSQAWIYKRSKHGDMGEIKVWYTDDSGVICRQKKGQEIEFEEEE